MLRKYEKTLEASGTNGSATATGTLWLHGVRRVHKVVIDFTSSATTADITITDAAETVTDTVLAKSNSDTDAVFYPRVAASKSADGSASTLTEVCPIAEALKISVAQANDDDVIVVRAFAE